MSADPPEIPPELLELNDWFKLLSSHLSDEEVAEESGISVETIQIGRAALLERERARIGRTVEDQYAEYRLTIQGILNEADGVIRRALNPAAGGRPALKTAGDLLVAKAKIVDQVVARGQELGILPKAVLNKNVKVSGNVLIGAMPDDEIFREIKRLRDDGERLLVDYGMTPFDRTDDPDIYSTGEHVIDAEPVVTEKPKPPRKKH